MYVLNYSYGFQGLSVMKLNDINTEFIVGITYLVLSIINVLFPSEIFEAIHSY